MAGRTGVGDLLKAFLDRTNYRAALLKAGEQRAVRNVDKLLGDAHASGLVAVSAFLEYVDGLRDSGAREGEARAVAQGAVQIMSVHQAKGLEFPIVVLGDAAWGGGGNREEVLIDPALGVLLPLKDQDAEEDDLPAVYRLAEKRQADREAAEADRLLYVAATRAREKLLVSGYLGGIKQDGTPYKLGGWLGKLGRPLGLHDLQVSHDEEGCAVHHRALQIGATEVDCVIYEPECAPYEPTDPPLDEIAIPDTPLPPPLLAPVHLGEAAGLREEPQFVFQVVPRSRKAKAPSRVVGELVHEAIAGGRLPAFGDDASFDHWMRARARAHGLIDGSQINHALSRGRRLLRRLQESEWFEELRTAEQRLHEVPFSVEREGAVDSGKIDLLYLTDGIWTIVEFKTDRVHNRDHFEAVLREKEYVDQARRYADAAEELLGRRPRCLLWMLDYRGRTRVCSVPPAGALEC
jgi:ATP-dependent exoDNAse (exonuclease V) beta subunit